MPLKNKIVFIGNSDEFDLPLAEDAESLQIKYQAFWKKASSIFQLPAFIKFEDQKFKVKTNDPQDIGEYLIIVTLDDGYSFPSNNSFKIII